jgi:hypothetical protein
VQVTYPLTSHFQDYVFFRLSLQAFRGRASAVFVHSYCLAIAIEGWLKELMRACSGFCTTAGGWF